MSLFSNCNCNNYIIDKIKNNIVSYRSYRGISEWLIYVSYATQSRYAGGFLSHQLFSAVSGLSLENCTSIGEATQYGQDVFSCRYRDSDAYLAERYGRDSSEFNVSDVLDSDFNLSISFAFPISLAIINCLLYLIPLPSFVKAKFRD